MEQQIREVNCFPIIYAGGEKGRRYRIVYCTWGNFNIGFEYRGATHWFESFDGCLGYMAGRGFIETHAIPKWRKELEENRDEAVAAIDKVFFGDDEESENAQYGKAKLCKMPI